MSFPKSPAGVNFRPSRNLLYLCLFLSGASALAYELVWARLLELSFGHTVYAFATAVAAFMGGTALGSHFLGPLADRVERPLRLYAGFELSIAAYCLAVPYLLDGVRHLYLGVHAQTLDHAVPHVLAQFLPTFLVLIVPTALMGATLPVMSRAFLRNPVELGFTVSTLYGTNTLGAAVGSLLVGFWLLPALGLRATNQLAVACSVLVAALAWFGGRDLRAEVAHSQPAATSPRRIKGMDGRVALILGMATSGFVAMTYQIAWTRALVLVIGSSTFAITAILFTFLLGIALGSHLATRFLLQPRPLLFGLLQLGISLSAMLLVPLFGVLPGLFLAVAREGVGSPLGMVLAQFSIVLAVVLIPTTLLGMTFPCGVTLLSRNPLTLGKDLGRLYAVNTCGAILGVTLTAFWLIPHLGARVTITLGVVLNALAGLGVVWTAQPRWRPPVLAGLAALVGLLWALPPWDPRLLTLGVYIYPKYLRDPSVKHAIEAGIEDIDEVEFFREGIGSTVAVLRYRNGDRSLVINGKIDAGDNVDMVTQVKLAEVPMLLHPAPRRVAVVGLGSGATAGAASMFQETEQIDIIELEPAVIQAAAHFNHVNSQVLDSPKARVVLDDARSFLEASDSPYDVIINEPSNPWMAGMADLFTVDFYRVARARLEPQEGIFCQWLPAYNTTPDEWELVVRSFLAVFPDASLWLSRRFDYLLVGRVGGGTVEMGDLQSRIERTPQLVSLAPYIGEAPLQELFGSFVLGPEELRAFAGDGVLNTDDRTLLQYWAPRSLHLGPSSTIERRIGRLRSRVFPEFLKGPFLDAPAARLWMVSQLLSRERYTEADRLLEALPEKWQGSGRRDVPRPPAKEDFEGQGVLPFLPMVGAYRPEQEDGEELEAWQVAVKYFSRYAGITSGAGREGTTGLVVRPVAGSGSSGFLVPLSVEPDSEYQISFWMHAQTPSGGTCGLGIAEFDTVEGVSAQPNRTFLQRHTVRLVREAVHSGTTAGWEHHSLRLSTGPKTAAVHLVFFLKGEVEPGQVVFDDVQVELGAGD